MPRVVKYAKPGELLEFVPTYDGNAESPDPVRVFVRAPSQGEKRAHLLELAKTRQSVEAQLAFTIESCRITIEKFVAHVDGYEDGAGPIKTALELWERGELKLCDEVAAWVMGLMELAEPQRKNSGGSSLSPPPATTASSGTAASASPPAGRAIAIAMDEATPASSTPSLG